MDELEKLSPDHLKKKHLAFLKHLQNLVEEEEVEAQVWQPHDVIIFF
jgi:hypothetical protein